MAANISIRYFYQTRKARKFTEYNCTFDSKRIAYKYIKDVTEKAVHDHVKLHLFVEGTFYQVDVDQTSEGWVAFESSNKGVRRIA